MNTRSYMAALNSIAKISRPGNRILEAKQNCCSVWVRRLLHRLLSKML